MTALPNTGPSEYSDPLPLQAGSVVAVFDHREQAESAVRSLQENGFGSDEIGFAMRQPDANVETPEQARDAHAAVTGAATGAVVGGLLATAASVLIPGVGPVLAGGILASFVGGAVAGTAVGGVIGALSGIDMELDDQQKLIDHFEQGRCLVVVKNTANADQAVALLEAAGGHEIRTTRRTAAEPSAINFKEMS